MNHDPFSNDDVTEAPESGDPEAMGHHTVDLVEQELVRIQAERDELFSRLARTTADFQNTRRRLQADADQRIQYANTGMVKALLPVLDSMERALSVDPQSADAKSILKGMEIVHQQFLNALKSLDVQEIMPQPGEPFDPTRHEAMLQQESEEHPPHSVTQVLQKGYAMHDRVIRPAQVAVSGP
jgi:molecular chaperone GrpE